MHDYWGMGDIRTYLQDRISPPTLFHYTSLAGVHGILSSNTLHATHVDWTNDSLEFRYGFDAAREYAISMFKRHEGSVATEELLKVLPGDAQAAIFPFFVASFSANGDVLSQWRAYGDGTGCYAIGFETNGLEELFPSAVLLPCIYAEGDQRRLLDAAWPLFRMPVVNNLRPGIGIHFTDIEDASRNLQELTAVIAAIMKHPAFEEEGEWRLFCHELYMMSVQRTKIRGTSEIPYLILDPQPTRLPITSIKIGPTAPDPDRQIELIQKMLDRTGHHNVSVLRSAVPFRASL
jgi:hypothetical protein